MNPRFALVGPVVLVVFCLWAAGVGRGDPQPSPAPAVQPAAAKPFPEIGKIYDFEFGGPQGTVTAEVVDVPREIADKARASVERMIAIGQPSPTGE